MPQKLEIDVNVLQYVRQVWRGWGFSCIFMLNVWFFKSVLCTESVSELFLVGCCDNLLSDYCMGIEMSEQSNDYEKLPN